MGRNTSSRNIQLCNEGCCKCPLTSIHCKHQTARRQQWFAAIRLGRMDVTESLLSNTNEPNEYLVVRDENDRSSLHNACIYGHSQLVCMLLELADRCENLENVLNARDAAQRMTPLMESCKRPNLFPIIEQLSQAGANWYLRNSDGLSAMDLASCTQNPNLPQIADLFANAAKVRARIHTRNKRQQTLTNRAPEGADACCPAACGHAEPCLAAVPTPPSFDRVVQPRQPRIHRPRPHHRLAHRRQRTPEQPAARRRRRGAPLAPPDLRPRIHVPHPGPAGIRDSQHPPESSRPRPRPPPLESPAAASRASGSAPRPAPHKPAFTTIGKMAGIQRWEQVEACRAHALEQLAPSRSPRKPLRRPGDSETSGGGPRPRRSRA